MLPINIPPSIEAPVSTVNAFHVTVTASRYD